MADKAAGKPISLVKLLPPVARPTKLTCAPTNYQAHIAEMELASQQPDFEERVGVMRRHLDLMVEVFGEEHGCRLFRKIGPWHSKRLGPANEFNKRIVKLSSMAAAGQGRRHDHKTTVDHALMRGLVTA